MAAHCPELIVNRDNAQNLTTFLQWFENSVKIEGPATMLNSASAVAQLFIQLEARAPKRNYELNQSFVPIVQTMMVKILDKQIEDKE